MSKNFRKHHLINILEKYSNQKLPLDVFLSKYFRLNKSVGSKDRKEIAEKTYNIIRWLGLIDYLCPKPLSWPKRIETHENLKIDKYLKDPNIQDHVKYSFPKQYYDLIKEEKKEKTNEFCYIANTKAPTTIRANPLKISRDNLFLKLEKNYNISKCESSELGIVFHKKTNFFAMPEFKEGLFEMQDEGSQLIAALVEPKDNYQILDYCSGSGGKTLAFAHKIKKGQIYLHDIREFILYEAKKRLKRAGIQNAQIKLPNSQSLNLLKNKMDIVLLDVPCSGSGTLRRNPDMKWKFKPSNLKNLIDEQRLIFEKGLSFLKKDGQVIYMTCSIFSKENEDQINYFIKKYNLKIEKGPIRLHMQENKMDSFFACILKRI